MVTKTRKRTGSDEQLARYEAIFEQIKSFTDAIRFHDLEIGDMKDLVAKAKQTYEDARDQLRELEEARDGAKAALVRFLSPKDGEFMPLFDRMNEPDEQLHGKNCEEWRKEPIAVLKLSTPSLNALIDNDIVVVGQLQDLVIAQPGFWHERFKFSEAAAAAIEDKLNDFIYDKTGN